MWVAKDSQQERDFSEASLLVFASFADAASSLWAEDYHRWFHPLARGKSAFVYCILSSCYSSCQFERRIKPITVPKQQVYTILKLPCNFLGLLSFPIYFAKSRLRLQLSQANRFLHVQLHKTNYYCIRKLEEVL